MWKPRLRNLGVGLAAFVSVSLAVAVGALLGQIVFYSVNRIWQASDRAACLGSRLCSRFCWLGSCGLRLGSMGRITFLRTVAWSLKSDESGYEWLELRASTDRRIRYFPTSARELRLSGLMFCGLFGLIALFAGHRAVPRRIALATGATFGPDLQQVAPVVTWRSRSERHCVRVRVVDHAQLLVAEARPHANRLRMLSRCSSAGCAACSWT